VSGAGDVWAELGRPGPESALVDGVELRRGSRVVLRPRAGGDVFDLALRERVAIVEALEEDAEGTLHVVVTLEDDPGRELGAERVLGHRFFFRLEEVEPLAGEPPPPPPRPRVLVAGIGNVFLGDDGFGVAVARRLADRGLPEAVRVVDFGIRGLDLAYALQEPYEAVVLVDAAPRGEAPGTLSVVEADPEEAEALVEAHAMDPRRVLGLARALGRVPPRVLVVACEPAVVPAGEHDDELLGELSEPVEAAVEGAVALVESLAAELAAEIERRKAVT
jgi:hydrogenase maturation protease